MNVNVALIFAYCNGVDYSLEGKVESAVRAGAPDIAAYSVKRSRSGLIRFSMEDI